MDQRFCGACGVDLQDALTDMLQSVHAAIERADRRAENGRFGDAAEELRALAIPDHTHLAEIGAEVRRRLTAFPNQRDAAIADARRAYQDAQQFAERRDFRRALDRLNQVLPAFQTAEMRELLQRVEATLAEAKQLKAEVRTAVANKACDGLLGKVERLFEIEPGGEKLEALLVKLRARQRAADHAQAVRAVEEAHGALQANNYAAARAALEEFPTSVQDEELLRRKRDADERIWLAAQLRTAPRISAVLIEVSRRLTELQPQDTRAAELHRELTRRWKGTLDGKGRGPHDPSSWAKPPAQTALGVSVDYVPIPQILGDFAKSAEIMPRNLLVAFGLALQGLGSAEVNFNLAPREEGTWLDKVARLKPAKNRRAAWGLDFGATSLKAVRLRLDSADKVSPGAVQIDDAVEMPLDRMPPADADSLPANHAPEAAAFEQLRNDKGIMDESLVVGLPGVQSLVRTFKLPPAKPDRLAEAVQYEVRASVPLGEHELVYGAHYGPTEASNGNTSNGARSQPVFAIAVSRTHVSGRLGWLGDLLSPSTIVQSNCVALANALRFAAARTGDETQTYAVVDIGAETLSVIVDDGGSPWFRSSYDGMNLFDKALSEELQLTRRQAAQLRKRPAAARQMHRTDRMLQPCFEHLLQAIRRGLDQFQRERNRSVDRVFLCGGGAHQLGLLRHLWFGS